MNNTSDYPDLVLCLPQLDPATAAALLDLCGHLQRAIWHVYGDAIEAHWQLTEPEQPIYQSRHPSSRRRR